MMDIEKLVEQNNGYLIVSDAVKNGISRYSISKFIRKHNLEKLACGVYASEDAWLDIEYAIGVRNRKVVFSHESALAIHGLMEREAHGIFVTVARSYNASHLRKLGCTVHAVKPEIFTMGLTQEKTFFSNEVQVYDVDRTICDIIHNQEHTQLQTFEVALYEYKQSRKKNVSNLCKYAKAMGIEEEIHQYLE